MEEHDDINEDEEINVSSITDTSADITLDPAADSDGRPNTDVEDEGVETVSQKKVKEIDFPAEENEHLSGYRIMDMDILLALIKSVACPKCFVVGSLTYRMPSMALHSSFVFVVTIAKIGRMNL